MGKSLVSDRFSLKPIHCQYPLVVKHHFLEDYPFSFMISLATGELSFSSGIVQIAALDSRRAMMDVGCLFGICWVDLRVPGN